jgi:hypothetical protein
MARLGTGPESGCRLGPAWVGWGGSLKQEVRAGVGVVDWQRLSQQSAVSSRQSAESAFEFESECEAPRTVDCG